MHTISLEDWKIIASAIWNFIWNRIPKRIVVKKSWLKDTKKNTNLLGASLVKVESKMWVSSLSHEKNHFFFYIWSFFSFFFFLINLNDFWFVDLLSKFSDENESKWVIKLTKIIFKQLNDFLIIALSNLPLISYNLRTHLA